MSVFHQSGHCWETLLSCSVEPLESRDACGSEFIPIEPGHHTHHINRSGNPKMLQVRFGKAAITGAAHAKGRRRLRSRRFGPVSQSILAGKCWRLLPTTGGLERFMLGLGSDRDGPPLVLFCRADTVDLARTATAIFCGELDLDHLIGSVVDGRSPTDTPVSFGADRLLAFPIDEELAGIDALVGVGLPLHIATSRTDHFNPVLLPTADQNGGSNIACIKQVLTRGEGSPLQIGMERLCHRLISRRSSGRGHMGDQVRAIFLTGFGYMHFVARPPRLALFAIASFLIIARADELVARRNILIAAPVALILEPDRALEPDAAQDLDGRALTQEARGISCAAICY